MPKGDNEKLLDPGNNQSGRRAVWVSIDLFHQFYRRIEWEAHPCNTTQQKQIQCNARSLYSKCALVMNIKIVLYKASTEKIDHTFNFNWTIFVGTCLKTEHLNVFFMLSSITCEWGMESNYDIHLGRMLSLKLIFVVCSCLFCYFIIINRK